MSEDFQVQAMFRGTILASGYGFIAQKITRDREITYPAKAIYAYLASFSGVKMECFPSVELMQAELGMPEATFYKHLKLLKSKGLVTTERIRTAGSKFKGTLYTLIINEREIEELVHTYEFVGMDKNDEKSHTHEFHGMETHGVESHGVESRELIVTDLKVTDIKIDTTTTEGQIGKEMEIEIPEEFKPGYIAPVIDPALGRFITLFQGEMGRPLSKIECDGSTEIYDLIGEDLARETLKRAVLAGTRNIRYMLKIAREWRMKGIKSLIDLEHEDKLFNDGKLKNGQGNKLQRQGSTKPENSKYDKFYL